MRELTYELRRKANDAAPFMGLELYTLCHAAATELERLYMVLDELRANVQGLEATLKAGGY